MLKKGGDITLPAGSSAPKSAVQGKSIPGKVESEIANIRLTISGKKDVYREHISDHIREVKEYLASR